MYRTRERVGASRTDAAGRLKLVSAVDMMQDCSMFWMDSEPSFRDFLRERGLTMLLASRQVDVLRMPRYGEELEVRTSIFSVKGFYGSRNTGIYDANGKPCLLSWGVGTFVDTNSGRMARLTPEEIGRVWVEAPLEMEYLDKKIPVPPGPGESLAPIPVRRNDVDLNAHMNNARYLEAALELLPDYPCRRLRIEYKAPAKRGDMLRPTLLQGPDGATIVLLHVAGDTLSAVLELTPQAL